MPEAEKPFIDQLVSHGWKFLAGSVGELAVTHRESFTEVMMATVLCERWRAIVSTTASLGCVSQLDQPVSAIIRLPAIEPAS